MPTGSNLNLMIRPENLTFLGKKKNHDTALLGRIENANLHWSFVRFRIRMRGDTLLTATCLTTTDLTLKRGTPVDVEWSPENVVMIM